MGTTAVGPERTVENGVTVIALGPAYESLDEHVLDQVKDQLVQFASEADPPRVVVDLSHTKFFGSSFIEVLFRMWRKVTGQPDGRFAVCGLAPYCLEVLKITHLDTLWHAHSSRAEAVKWLGS